MNFKYTDVVPWGRSFEEYLDMFLLAEEDLTRKILGVGDGPASFNAQMHQRGIDIVSVDPIYQFSEEQVRERIRETYDTVISQTRDNQDKFVWDKIPSVEVLSQVRMEAMEKFCRDFENGKKQGRYLNHSLPSLPFPDKSFDLVLSSHFLFLYSANLDLDFHLKAVRELVRIGSEVRIFPVVDYNSSPSPFLSPVIDDLSASGISCSIEPVRYHFQKTGNQMLRIQGSAT